MNLPQKNYYSLDALADRWRLPMADLQYYAENSMLEVQAWLDLPVVKLYRLTQTIEGTTVPVFVGLDSYRDFAVVEPRGVRRIFRHPHKSSVIRHFRPLRKADIMRPVYHAGCSRLAANHLVVSRAERDRFEREYEIAPHAAMPPASFVGRPSVMRKITIHFMERCKANALEPSLQKEGDYLFAWADIHIRGVQIPTAQTIRNAIRVRYREHMADARV